MRTPERPHYGRRLLLAGALLVAACGYEFRPATKETSWLFGVNCPGRTPVAESIISPVIQKRSWPLFNHTEAQLVVRCLTRQGGTVKTAGPAGIGLVRHNDYTRPLRDRQPLEISATYRAVAEGLIGHGIEFGGDMDPSITVSESEDPDSTDMLLAISDVESLGPVTLNGKLVSP